MPGKDSGSQYSAAQVFSDVCEMIAREIRPVGRFGFGLDPDTRV